MPRIIETMTLHIHTGARGTADPALLRFNGHEVALEPTSGGTGPGEVLEARFSPASFAHSVALSGPTSGEWDIERVSVRYKSVGAPWTVTFGPITLDGETAVDIWQDAPPPTFDV